MPHNFCFLEKKKKLLAKLLETLIKTVYAPL